MIRRRLTLAVVFVVAGAWPVTAHAQTTRRAGGGGGTQTAAEGATLKRTPLPAALLPVCALTRSSPAAPNDAQRQQARDLASRAQQAAILGDTATALSSLRSAKALDPADPDLAYQLARIYESGAAADSAVSEYCRFLSLAPNASDAADARDRVAVLARPKADPAIESANAVFQQGIVAYDAGRMADAESRFGRALEAQPSWAEAYFDRGLARVAKGDRELAASDFEVYLRLRPTAPDRQVVSARVDALRRARLAPGQALALGVFIPGAGQFYTHRPVWGTAVLLATGGAIALALTPQNKTATVQQQATDPFGNPYTYTTTRQTTERPALVAGLIGAAAIDLIGATEAAMFASRSDGTAPRRVSAIVAPSGHAGGTGVLGLRIAF